MRHLFGRKLLLALASAVVAAGAAGGIAYATGVVGSDQSGTVTVCVNKSGAARFVDPGTACKKGEQAVQLAAAWTVQPTDYTVDCDAGQKIQDVVDEVANGVLPVTIDVSGTCHESVRISRDRVSLYASSSGATIEDPDYALIFDGAHNVTVDGLTLTSTGSGFSAWSGATFSGQNLDVTGQVEVVNGSSGRIEGSTLENPIWVRGGMLDVNGSNVAGIGCDAGYVQLNDSTVSGSDGDGVDANGTCEVSIWGGTVENSSWFGVAAWGGGDVTIENATIQDNARGGVLAQTGGSAIVMDSTISGNHEQGVSGYMGGSVSVSRSTIEGNGGGLTLTGASSGGIDATTIRNNSGNGVDLQDTSVLLAGSGDNAITGNDGWGVWCQEPPAVAQFGGYNVNVGDVSGNGAGEIHCPGFPGFP